MVHILQMGVFFTGFIKDMLSLPRPLSPPLHRITMSGSAALEYGFPSTHSTNAVSVATYALLLVNSPDSDLTPSTKLLLQFVFCCYAVSIVLGRLYCGMHGFLDVFMGSTMGALLSIIDYTYVPKIDAYWYSSSWLAMAIMVLVIFALIRVHPEPADDCPCFDDSVSSAGVMIGCEVGGWHYAAGNWAWSSPVPASVPFDFEYLGWGIIGARIVVGILVIFAWRDVMKRILLKNLPPLFRIIEKCGLDWPRKHFTPASEYSFIPGRLKMDNTLPSLSDIPGFLKSMRHPGRGRGDSVGPQSAADAYEAIAYREKRRRDSLSSIVDENEVVSHVNGFSIIPGTPQITTDTAVSSAVQPKSFGIMSDNSLPTPAQSRVGSYEHMMGQGFVAAPATPPESDKDDAYDGSEIIVGERNAAEEEEIFSKLEKPRVRYDVEVVTKLVVYTGKFASAHPCVTILLKDDRYWVAFGRDHTHHLRDYWPRYGLGKETVNHYPYVSSAFWTSLAPTHSSLHSRAIGVSGAAGGQHGGLIAFTT